MLFPVGHYFHAYDVTTEPHQRRPDPNINRPSPSSTKILPASWGTSRLASVNRIQCARVSKTPSGAPQHYGRYRDQQLASHVEVLAHRALPYLSQLPYRCLVAHRFTTNSGQQVPAANYGTCRHHLNRIHHSLVRKQTTQMILVSSSMPSKLHQTVVAFSSASTNRHGF